MNYKWSFFSSLSLEIIGDFVYYEEPDFEYYTIGLIEEIKVSRRDKFSIFIKCFYRTRDIPDISKQGLPDRDHYPIHSNIKLIRDVSLSMILYFFFSFFFQIFIFISHHVLTLFQWRSSVCVYVCLYAYIGLYGLHHTHKCTYI